MPIACIVLHVSGAPRTDNSFSTNLCLALGFSFSRPCFCGHHGSLYGVPLFKSFSENSIFQLAYNLVTFQEALYTLTFN